MSNGNAFEACTQGLCRFVELMEMGMSQTSSSGMCSMDLGLGKSEALKCAVGSIKTLTNSMSTVQSGATG